jgi:hypothetical protein
MSNLFKLWLELFQKPDPNLYVEKKGARATGLDELKQLLGVHFVGEVTILKMGGFKKAANTIKNSLPDNKKVRSGDLAELIATEYVDSETNFKVPIKKLRWKSDRKVAMRGNDIIATSGANPVAVLKGECKSRANFAKGVVAEALKTLNAHGGRPNPSSLAFITKRLYEENRDAEAKVFENLQCRNAIAAASLTHLFFVLSGNDPCDHLKNLPNPKKAGISRLTTVVKIDDHGKFVSKVFE